MTRRWSSGARPGRPAAAAPGEDETARMGSIAPVLTTLSWSRFDKRLRPGYCLAQFGVWQCFFAPIDGGGLLSSTLISVVERQPAATCRHPNPKEQEPCGIGGCTGGYSDPKLHDVRKISSGKLFS